MQAAARATARSQAATHPEGRRRVSDTRFPSQELVATFRAKDSARKSRPKSRHAQRPAAAPGEDPRQQDRDGDEELQFAMDLDALSF